LDVIADVGRFKCAPYGGGHAIDVGRMHIAPIALQRAIECTGLEPVNAFEFRGPGDRARPDIPVPRTHPSRGKSKAETALVPFAQRRLPLRLFAKITLRVETGLERDSHPVMLERGRNVIGDLLRSGNLFVREYVRLLGIQHELAKEPLPELQWNERQTPDRLASEDRQVLREGRVLLDVRDENGCRGRLIDRPR